MQLKAIFRILGILIMIFSVNMLPPIIVALCYDEVGSISPFVKTFLISFVSGFLLWLLCYRGSHELKVRDGFLLTTLAWVVLSIYGAIPFMLTVSPHSFMNAFFESVSGLTTTGAEVFTGLNNWQHSLIFYHQQLHFFGGMGILILAVAILSFLGVGGMQLYRAESSGPVKDSKITPRVMNTAKLLWSIYIILTVFCAIAYWFIGMTAFDAICEAFSTIATGGFSIHDESFAYYNNLTVDAVAIFFMILAASNFGLHYLLIRHRRIAHYWQDLEFRVFICTLGMLSIVVTIMLLIYHIYPTLITSAVKGSFAVVSLISTTGFSDGTFGEWPTFVPFLIMFVTLIGGCASSTAGGIKVIRMALMQKAGLRELKRLLRPKVVIPIKIGEEVLSETILQGIFGFFIVYIMLYVLLLLSLVGAGTDITTAFGVLSACIANAGMGIGKASSNFSEINEASKGILVFAMLIGRLEIFTVLILFVPEFWRS